MRRGWRRRSELWVAVPVAVKSLPLRPQNTESVDQLYFRDTIFASVSYEEINNVLCSFSKYKRTPNRRVGSLHFVIRFEAWSLVVDLPVVAERK
ncbi:hypothetical protein GRJ2_000116400 [Grus japonensis]|uniref:Uncharacterized protein n=1 Tax=Grus japonensis TaxID=30415 RepID=A0ABC9VXM0_GRUJA